MEKQFMHIDKANLKNLTQLWQSYGARTLYQDDQFQLRKNISWPNRVWANMERQISALSLNEAAKYAPNSALFPFWPAITEDGSAAQQANVDALVSQNRHWKKATQHTAMAMKLNKHSTKQNPVEVRYPIQIKRLSSVTDIAHWVATGSKAFGYTIDAKVILPLLARDDIQILLAYNEESRPVATGLLFKTGEVAGVHQIGVPSEYQGKGYGTQMMRFLIQCAEKWQAKYAVLQASEAGRPVYQKLGFVDQFLITYLQKYKN